MIKVILVDDEKPALKELQYFLRDYHDISVVGMFTDPLEAIHSIGQHKPEVVFLDIYMPQMGGMEAAVKILEDSPETEIIFVTAFDQYAVDAFEIQALDYVLKPISQERFKKTMDRIFVKKDSHIVADEKTLKIRCFGSFQLGWENREPVKWRTEKNRELFAYLVHNRGKSLTKDQLLDVLWPDDDPDKAIRQLYNGIYYIRKAVEAYGIDKNFIRIGNGYCLTLEKVDLDVDNFCNKVKYLKGLTAESLVELIELYSDGYLYGDDFLWVDFERERLSKLYYQCLMTLSEKYLEKQQYEASESTLFMAYEKFPLEENVTERLLELYLITRNKLKAVRHMDIFSDFLNKELGVKPDKKIMNLYIKILN